MFGKLKRVLNVFWHYSEPYEVSEYQKFLTELNEANGEIIFVTQSETDYALTYILIVTYRCEKELL